MFLLFCLGKQISFSAGMENIRNFIVGYLNNGVIDQNLVDQFLPNLNFIYRGRLDPIIQLFLNGASMSEAYRWFQLVIGFLGVLCCLKVLGQEWKTCFISTFFVLVSLFFALGETVLHCQLQWLPWFLFSVLIASPYAFLAILIFGLFWLLSAGPLAFFGIVVVFFLKLFLSPGSQRSDLVSLASLALLSLILLPEYPFPAYPKSASLVPTSIFDFRPGALLGPDSGISMLLPSGYQEQMLKLTLNFSLFAGVILFLSLVFSRFRSAALAGIIFLASWTTLELYLAAANSFHSPFAYLVRIVPGLGIFPLFWGVSGVLFILFLILFVREQKQKFLAAASCTILALLLGGEFLKPSFQLGSLPITKRVYARQIDSWAEVLSFSPSAFILEKEGTWLAEEDAARTRHFRNLKRILRTETGSWEVSASSREELAGRAVDGMASTSWSTAGGDSEEEFKLVWEKPSLIYRVILSLEGRDSNYARSFAVEGFNRSGKSKLLRDFSPWRGPVKWTDFGFPYYGSKSEVVIDLPEPVILMGLKFRQTLANQTHPWSIAEIKLYAPKD